MLLNNRYFGSPSFPSTFVLALVVPQSAVRCHLTGCIAYGRTARQSHLSTIFTICQLIGPLSQLHSHLRVQGILHPPWSETTRDPWTNNPAKFICWGFRSLAQNSMETHSCLYSWFMEDDTVSGSSVTACISMSRSQFATSTIGQAKGAREWLYRYDHYFNGLVHPVLWLMPLLICRVGDFDLHRQLHLLGSFAYRGSCTFPIRFRTSVTEYTLETRALLKQSYFLWVYYLTWCFLSMRASIVMRWYKIYSSFVWQDFIRGDKEGSGKSSPFR